MKSGEQFNPTIAWLLADAQDMELGSWSPRKDKGRILEGLALEALFESKPIVDDRMARCVLSGLWLLFDYFERSHELSQSIETSTGSYWHAILHRREPDASNAAYWFRRVGSHPIHPELSRQAQRIAPSMFTNSTWDPCRFVDLSDRAGGNQIQALKAVQRAEWRLLFDFSYRNALGK